METDPRPGHGSLKERAVEEFITYWILVGYLFLCFGLLTIYRRLVLANLGITYLHYGFAVIEALVIAKIILIGRAVGFGRSYERKPLIVPVIYKSIVFGALVFAFGALERAAEAMYHRQGPKAFLAEIANIGMDELVARVVVLMVTLVPMFALWEMGRVIGLRKLAAMFFSRSAAETSPEDPGPHS